MRREEMRQTGSWTGEDTGRSLGGPEQLYTQGLQEIYVSG
jgi:hypothetical protein